MEENKGELGEEKKEKNLKTTKKEVRGESWVGKE